MRSRSNSGVRLDLYQRMVNKTILKHQNAVTGLICATDVNSHSWVRDNVYAILSVWGLGMAYHKMADMDEDRAKAYELEKSVVKLMRGLLQAMMRQVDKLERFKHSQSPRDALHAKYNSKTCATVVGDRDWGHLQIDATSLYLLTLAQMTASGLQIIFTTDEVGFVQNLVFYIESAYRIPDYGIWERGDKTNHGLPELNASSIGMAKAALEAINELDLFGARGGPCSVIYTLADESEECKAILQSVLPRESSSKEVDAALLSVISFPAFAVDDEELIEITRQTIVDKLEGYYGCSRFIRDGYKTSQEDPNRLHYEPWELKIFENIECEWPLFFAYMVLDGVFSGNQHQVDSYRDKLDAIMVRGPDGIPLMPELYTVPRDKVEAEYKEPHSQERKAAGMLPHKWGQSLYVLGRLLAEGFLSPGEIDPLNRRLTSHSKPDLVIQVVILAEDSAIQEKLLENDIEVQTMAQVTSVQVYPARVLSHMYSLLGKNEKMNLSGRPSSEVGHLATSKLYKYGNKTFAFFPQYMDQHAFYLPLDTEFMLDMFRTEVGYLHDNWTMVGRPTLVIPITHRLLADSYSWRCQHHTDTVPEMSKSEFPASFKGMLHKMKTGYIAGTRVEMGCLSDFITTSCVTRLSFLDCDCNTETQDVMAFMESFETSKSRHLAHSVTAEHQLENRRYRRSGSVSVKGIVKRTRSIQIEPAQLQAARSRHSSGLSTSSEEVTSPVTSPVDIDLKRHHTAHLLSTSAESALKTVKSDLQWSAHLDQYDGISCVELVEVLHESSNLQEQADIIHYLYHAKGLKWDTHYGGVTGCTVEDLLTELYDKAGHLKQWWLVRHTAGILNKRVEDLAKSATYLIVRQKQLSIGLPPEPREKIITRPLSPDELAHIIREACGDDSSMAVLTQELIVYLGMFVRTEPKLFSEMLRIRIGLIIQVMATELARTLKCTGDEASDYLLNLSPFEVKTLLHHILSGKEFTPAKDYEQNLFMTPGEMITQAQRKKSVVTSSQALTNEEDDRQGQWQRRRRLDGALNRVPVGFYSRVWKVLERCSGLSIEGHVLSESLTKEMTPGEFKFALQVEMEMNRIPEPEYRQLMVEAIMVLTLIAEHDKSGHVKMNWIIPVEKIVKAANEFFLEDQVRFNGDATLCCAAPKDVHPVKCHGAHGICQNFYDSAPSGRYGTMTYLFRAVATILNFESTDGKNVDCTIT